MNGPSVDLVRNKLVQDLKNRRIDLKHSRPKTSLSPEQCRACKTRGLDAGLLAQDLAGLTVAQLTALLKQPPNQARIHIWQMALIEHNGTIKAATATAKLAACHKCLKGFRIVRRRFEAKGA